MRTAIWRRNWDSKAGGNSNQRSYQSGVRERARRCWFAFCREEAYWRAAACFPEAGEARAAAGGLPGSMLSGDADVEYVFE